MGMKRDHKTRWRFCQTRLVGMLPSQFGDNQLIFGNNPLVPLIKKTPELLLEPAGLLCYIGDDSALFKVHSRPLRSQARGQMANNLPSDDHVVVDAPKLNAQYRIDSLLGEGGMGRVYRAEHQLTGQVVAIKALREELSQDNTFRTRFLIEAKVLSKLDHPSITHLLNFIAEEDGRLFLVMQYVAGPTLDDLLIQLGPLPPAVAMTVFHEILAAFDYAHTQGIIHRDIKPANIVLPPTGGVKVMDFGIARMEHQIKLTTTGASLGSPAYMAPEQVTGGPLDSRCDIYALGCMLFEITTGDIPFNGETGYSVMKAHVEDRPPDPRDLVSMPDPIADAILWALKKNP